MNYDLLKMEISEEHPEFFTIDISLKNEKCQIKFSPQKKELIYIGNNSLIKYLKLREFQLRKLLHNKRPNSFYIGFTLNFVLHDGLPDINFYDRTKITILDNQ